MANTDFTGDHKLVPKNLRKIISIDASLIKFVVLKILTPYYYL